MKPVEILTIEKYYNIELLQLTEDERAESKVEFYKNENTFSLNSKNEVVKINLKDNNLVDLDGLLNLQKTVTHLNLAATRIQNIEVLANFKNLIYIDLSTNSIEDINSIIGLKKIEFLYLDNNKISKIPQFDLPNLYELWLYSNEITDITNLKKLFNLTYLNISNNKVKNIDAINNLKNLNHIHLNKNNITDISPLCHFKSFSYLDLSSNEINDITSLSNIETFDKLNLENNQIEDISPLKSIDIKELFIGENYIIDLSPLYSSLKTKKIGFINVNSSPNLLYPIEEVARKGEERIVEWFDMIFENIEKCKQKINDIKNNENVDNTSLDLGMMGLTDLSLIPELFELENLEELILSNHYAKYNEDGQYWEKVESENNFYPNNIYNIPNNIKKLKKLKKLIIGGDWKKDNKWNRWRIKDIAPVFSLKQLEYLNISNNSIEKITVTNRIKLPKLKIIHLNNNKLNTFYTLTKFPNLEELYLSNNELNRVNNLANVESLKTIDLHRNKIKSIHPIIDLLKNTQINISNTKWKKNTINIQDNPLEKPNYETINTGKEAVIRYFESLDDWNTIVNKEIKLILVGNSEVGKSTLVKYLDDEKDLEKTHDATHWMIEKDISSKHIIKKINEKCNLRVFDFGGQDYYHDTHHIFFTNNTVYLLLWEKNTNNVKQRSLIQTVNGSDRNIETQDYPVEYWLESVKHFIKEKSNIIVDNKVNYEYNSNLLLIQNKVNNAEQIIQLNNLKLNSNYPFVYDFINIDILKEKRNLVHFDNLLTEIINEMQVIGSNILEYQDIIRIELEHYDEKAILSLFEFKIYCNSKLRKSISDDELKDLCSYLKQLGLIFYLPTHKKIYLKKKWIFENMYEILDGLLKYNGEFDREYISKTIGLDLENQLIDGLLDLMFEFKIVFLNPINKKYIAPLYLPKEPSDGVNLFLLENRIPYRRFEYNGFIHKTIILDFFQKYGEKTISDGKIFYYWKDGLIIKDDETSTILQIKFGIGNGKGNAFIDIFKLNNKDKENFFVNEIIEFIKDINNKFFRLDKKDIDDSKVAIEEYYEEMVTINNVDFVSLRLLNENAENGKFIFGERKINEKKGKVDNTKKDINLSDYKQFINNKNMMKKIFISYSKFDDDYKKEFVKHLITLKDENLIDPFNCDEIDLGEDSHEVIQRKLAECDYMIALVSVDYMNTKYIREFEIDKANELEKKIIPIIIKPCDWETSKLGKHHASLRGTNISLDKKLYLDGDIKEVTKIERAAFWTAIIKEFREKLFK